MAEAEIFMFYLNAHQRAEEDEPLCSHQTVSFPTGSCGLMYKAAMGTVIGVMHELSNMDQCSPRLTWLKLLPSAKSANWRDSYEPLIWHHYPKGSANSLALG